MMRIQYCCCYVFFCFLIGCRALVTTTPLANRGEACLSDGIYELLFNDAKTSIQLSIAYDATNCFYRVDAGTNGSFKALCRMDGDGQILTSISLSCLADNRIVNVTTECERLFLVKVYANARLVKVNDTYDIWVLNKTDDIADGCYITALPPEKILPKLPSSNIFPFSCKGKLRFLESTCDVHTASQK